MEIRVARMCQVHIVSYRCYRAARLASDTENAKQPEFYVDPKKLGAFSVQFSGHKKSRKRLFFNDLRLSFCGEGGGISVCLNRVLNVLFSITSFVTKIYRVSNVYIEIKRKFSPQIGPQFLSLHTKNG